MLHSKCPYLPSHLFRPWSIVLFKLYFCLFVNLFSALGVYMIQHAFGSQDNLWVSPYAMWIAGTKLRSSDFICCAGSSRHDFLMRTYYVVGTGLWWSA